jgi:hypothetical protein
MISILGIDTIVLPVTGIEVCGGKSKSASGELRALMKTVIAS